ncbi:type II toxin-antitoxin system MqsA family antitoxin [Pseudomonas sp. GM17]|uniref:type II toxin-antitoxin system MqsA family antitoxin n=1 Tax=Pseudomonas sp. GM17 TaxID=1144323 RepID=UPI000272772F|nr:type II toxin-antitoxin system MqsA family antitoxin [Pseudomonas sp. GM17]WIE52605.1 type II toxin-antitoxin system MqsA family antitoxin [Pseudomonas sp. GM17]
MSYQKEACPICGEGSLSNADYVRKVEHNGTSGLITTYMSVCDTCGCEQSSPTQIRDNRREFTAFQKRVDNRLSGEEIKRIRSKLKLKQNEASKIFGGGANSFAKYEADDVTQSEAMDKLIRICSEVPQAYAWLVRNSKPVSIRNSLQLPKFEIGFAKPLPHPENNYPVFVEDAFTSAWRMSSEIIEVRETIGSNVTIVPVLNATKPFKTSESFKDFYHVSQSSSRKAYMDADYEKYAFQGSPL